MKMIAQGVYQIPVLSRESINCYLIEDVLIDAGIRSSATSILKALKGKKVRIHALTHAHADHQGSSKTICQKLNIPLWCSHEEKPYAESGMATAQYNCQLHPLTLTQKHFWMGKGFPVEKTIQEGDQIGGFRVINTPGHSKGHLSFFRDKDKVLIIGDVAVNMNFWTTMPQLQEPPALFTADRAINKLSIKKLAALNPLIIGFGHGQTLKNKGEFQKFADQL
jgi:glyoxylase-like metal-dependent hydrolase (beta-lactamase superfamily II)